MVIGLIRETIVPPDRRVALTPGQCRELLDRHAGLGIIAEPSEVRCFTDGDYREAGIAVSADMSRCDCLLGIKEVKIDHLAAGKKYFFFSHTIKRQQQNRGLLKAILDRRISLMDYECLTDAAHNRIIGFGRFAGMIGTYNGILGYGKKYGLFSLKPIHLCAGREEMHKELDKAKLPNIKMLVTGGGRSANGAIETLSTLKIRKVTPFEFLTYSYMEPVYCQLHSKDYYEAKDGSSWNKQEFYAHPEKYQSTFLPYTKACDLLLSCHYWDPASPRLFTKGDMKAPGFRISVIADITCDLDGSVPATIRTTSIEAPFFGYNPKTKEEGKPFDKNTITVMAAYNLPGGLPKDASEMFGADLIERVVPALLEGDKDGLMERATITRDGKLTDSFSYLADYVASGTL